MKSTIFEMGHVVATPGVMEEVSGREIHAALAKHAKGDWGTVCKQDWIANQVALRNGTRLLSAYKSTKGVKFWIITEADRSVTTVLLPDEY